MQATYSALELARAAGYTIRPVATGGVREGPAGLLDVGPEATERQIVRYARKYLAPSVKKAALPVRRRTGRASDARQ